MTVSHRVYRRHRHIDSWNFMKIGMTNHVIIVTEYRVQLSQSHSTLFISEANQTILFQGHSVEVHMDRFIIP